MSTNLEDCTFNLGSLFIASYQSLISQTVIIELIFKRSIYTLNTTISYYLSMLYLYFYSLLVSPRNAKKSTLYCKNLFSYFFVVLLQPFFKDVAHGDL